MVRLRLEKPDSRRRSASGIEKTVTWNERPRLRIIPRARLAPDLAKRAEHVVRRPRRRGRDCAGRRRRGPAGGRTPRRRMANRRRHLVAHAARSAWPWRRSNSTAVATSSTDIEKTSATWRGSSPDSTSSARISVRTPTAGTVGSPRPRSGSRTIGLLPTEGKQLLGNATGVAELDLPRKATAVGKLERPISAHAQRSPRVDHRPMASPQRGSVPGVLDRPCAGSPQASGRLTACSPQTYPARRPRRAGARCARAAQLRQRPPATGPRSPVARSPPRGRPGATRAARPRPTTTSSKGRRLVGRVGIKATGMAAAP